ncbi:hypothetical protein B0H67DRAFT_599074 [Lasiosphaeris hirsuta]|uniref:Major facilitator superfamily (MFS) profile domain-containing protein n=1 Tax=Lasiosphaeris hirsuta TaxID=260670 RepID=A0AA40ANM6_9PEZI|nr:hypothetical protein B0H67DRAFT_599074 [Lasiosphaeris hirsuta]
MAPYLPAKGHHLTLLLTVATATAMAPLGYDQAISPTLPPLTPNPALHRTIAALYPLGSFLGALAALYLGPSLGRKQTVLLGTGVLAAGAVLQVSAFDLGQMVVGRVVAGVGSGVNSATAPVWLAETVRVRWRGGFVGGGVFGFLLGGLVLGSWVVYGFSTSGEWRAPVAVQLVFVVVVVAMVPWLPESPRWLIAEDRIDEANAILANLEDKDRFDPFVITQSKAIQRAVQVRCERQDFLPWRDVPHEQATESASCLRRLALGMGVQAMQQLSGVSVTSYYLPLVLTQSVGLSEHHSHLLAACSSASYLLSSLISVPVVERWGRRKTMMYSALGQGLCFTGITICLRYDETHLDSELRCRFAEASVAFFFLFYVFFGVGWQGIPWLYPAEVNSLSMRTRSAALGAATNWIVSFAVVEVTPRGISGLGWRFCIIWTVLNLAFVPAVYLFCPETAGRTLEDMDRVFQDNQGAFMFRNAEAACSKRPRRYIEMEWEERGVSTMPSQLQSIFKATMAADNPTERLCDTSHSAP